MKAAGDLLRAVRRRLWLARNREAFTDADLARKPRLLVDVSVIMRHDAATGIQRVVRSVWSHLNRLESPDFDVVPVYAGRTHGYCLAPKDFLSRPRVAGGSPVGARAGDKFLGLDLAAHYLPNYVDQLAAWRTSGASVHVVVYDLLPLSRPDWFEEATSRHFARWLDALMTTADQALCISDSVAEELRHRTVGTAAHQRLKVGRLYLSGDIAGSLPSGGLSPAVQAALDRTGSRKAVLMIGTIEPRKGYDRALDAFEHLWDSRGDLAPDLIIVGKPGWKTAELQQRIRTHPQLGHRLHWLEDVSDEALTRFYEASCAVFLASFDEGFGLPAVEAATHRRWALVRDRPVFREQRLPNVRYFEDDSAESLAGEVMALIEAAEAAPPPAANPPKWSWCVERLLEEIGLAHDPGIGRMPMLRIVS